MVISGFDPQSAGYYSTGNKLINNQRIMDLLQTNQIITAWDGRHERANFKNESIIQQITRPLDSIKVLTRLRRKNF